MIHQSFSTLKELSSRAVMTHSYYRSILLFIVARKGSVKFYFHILEALWNAHFLLKSQLDIFRKTERKHELTWNFPRVLIWSWKKAFSPLLFFSKKVSTEIIQGQG